MTVVGAGRVGSALVRAFSAAGEQVDVVRRGEAIPPGDGPIVVATRADDVAGVIQATPKESRANLVFVQNGMIRPLLQTYGLLGNTQGLIYFAATSREGPVDAGAESLFWGPHAARIVALLRAGGIPAREITEASEFGREIAIKLAWNVIFGLLGDRHGETVGETVRRHRDEVEALAAEITPVLERGVGTMIGPIVDRLVAYSESIPTFRAGVRELRWRSGWVRDAAREAGIPTPLHDRWLGAVVSG